VSALISLVSNGQAQADLKNAFAQDLSDLRGANSATSSDSTGKASTGTANLQANLPDGGWSLDRQFPTKDLFLQKSKFEYISARLLALLDIVVFNAITSIAIPDLG
jgi:hypothetical protein